MKSYERLKMEFIELDTVDVICTSSGDYDIEDTGKNENTGDSGTMHPVSSYWNL